MYSPGATSKGGVGESTAAEAPPPPAVGPKGEGGQAGPASAASKNLSVAQRSGAARRRRLPGRRSRNKQARAERGRDMATRVGIQPRGRATARGPRGVGLKLRSHWWAERGSGGPPPELRLPPGLRRRGSRVVVAVGWPWWCRPVARLSGVSCGRDTRVLCWSSAVILARAHFTWWRCVAAVNRRPGVLLLAGVRKCDWSALLALSASS